MKSRGLGDTIEKLTTVTGVKSVTNKIARVVKREIIPRAQQGWEQAKPELKKAKSKAQGLARKLRHKIEN